jgi:excisionase family DNA binding protein
MERKLIPLRVFCRRYAVGRTKAFALIKDGSLPFRKIGKKLVIPEDDAEAWAAKLPAARQNISFDPN